jgi:hypothetical protein
MARLQRTRTWGTVLVLGLASVTCLSPAAGWATAAKGASAAAKDGERDAAAGQRELEAGIVALQAGRTDQALQHLNSALSGGKLPSTQMARALYYRGVAYRKQGKPALAIADLTSALWLKNGLDPAQKADALENRAAAYREAGLADQAEADAKKAAAAGAAKPVPSQTGQQASAPSVVAPAQQPAAAAAPSPPAPASSGGFNLFSALFGGSGSSSPEAAPAPQPRAAAPAPPAAAGWSENTEVVAKPQKAAAVPLSFGTVVKRERETAAAPPVTKGPVRTVASPNDPPEPGPVVTGSTGTSSSARRPGPRLQVAMVRSFAEAQTIAARLKNFGAPQLAGLEPEIDETTIGNMGTFYRVRIGPFANADDPRLLCVKLRGSGFDCLVTPQ